MAKLSLGTVANLLGNPTSAATTINNNSTLIISAFENTLSRDGTTPNQMNSDLDMNNNDILNVGSLSVDQLTLDGVQVGTADVPLVILDEILDARDSAQAWAEGTLPGGPGTKSSKEWAEEAEASAESVRNEWIIAARFQGTGVESDFPLSIDPGSENGMFVSASGTDQAPGGTNPPWLLVYNAGNPFIRINAPTDVEVVVRTTNGVSVGTPSDASVTEPKIGTAAVTTTKLANKSVTLSKIQDVNTGVLLGRKTAGTGGLEQITPSDFAAMGFSSGGVTDGMLFGMSIGNNASDIVNDINIFPGKAASDDVTPVLIALNSLLTKRTDAAWAVGDNAGGWLDGASMPNGTGHVFVIRRSDTGVVDVGISASVTPTLPTGYDSKRRVGSIIRKSNAILGFIQNGDDFILSAPPIDRNSTAAVADSLLAITVPLGISVSPFLENHLTANSASNIFVGVGSASFSTAGIRISHSNGSGPQVGHVSKGVVTNTSGQIRYVQANAAGTVAINELQTNGWSDTRGRI